MELLPFQRRFVTAALAPSVRTAALSLPRGNGKSALCAWLVSRAMTPGDALWRPGTEMHLAAASIGQVRRTTWKLLREFLTGSGYRWAETQNACHVVHPETNTRASVLASSGQTAQGLVRCPLLVADEPGAWQVNGGQLLYDAIVTAQGKPGAALRALFVGTLAPAVSGWWHDLVASGSQGSTHVTAVAGDRERWDRASEIRRCNPLMWRFPESRAVLLEERDKARRDSRLKAQFLSYRLNLPSSDESAVLLTAEDWARVCRRSVAAAEGQPVAAVDLGGGRAWSAAVALWPSGRTEAVAVAPGIPDVAAQEKRDRVPKGTYQRLVDRGALLVDDGRRAQRPDVLMGAVREWAPSIVVCDRYRLSELQDAARGLRVVPRVTRWATAAEDIRALRRLAMDGPLSVAQESRPLLKASLSAAMVANDDSGNVRLVKRGTNNEARDDVAAAWVLAAGALARVPARRPTHIRVA